jgi:RHH-type rel operon transcriptional repressor/antitoxin RelB
MYSKENAMLALRLPPAIEKRLQALADKTGRTKSFYAREAILQHIEDLEDAYLASARLKRPAKRWSLDDIEQGRDLRK